MLYVTAQPVHRDGPPACLQPGPEAEAGVQGMRQHLVGMGLEDLPVEAPRIVVLPPEDD